MHGLTTEVPHAVWVLIDTHARAPRSTPSKLEIVRASGSALAHGVEERIIEGVPVRLTSPAKTVADCFRYRRHVGLDVAIGALREYLVHGRSPKKNRKEVFSIEALVAAGTADRVSSVMRPYLEALA
jgi:predicted transcriptional regulator of viral defense system